MDNHYNIYICGVGGQGIIKTSTIIGEAAMNQGLDVVMSEIHGMSQRGGSVSTELKIGGYNSKEKKSVWKKFLWMSQVSGMYLRKKRT